MSEPPQLVATYRYEDEDGVLLYETLRYAPKSFKQRAANGAWSLDGVRRVPYLLPNLLAAKDGRSIVVCEGERDVDRLAEFAICATTNAGGASWKWTDDFVAHFKGVKRIVVIVDSDAPGRNAGNARAELLSKVCPDVRILDLAPDRADGFDVSDFLETHSKTELLARLKSAPPFVPPTQPLVQRIGGIHAVRASDVPIAAIQWLWRDFIPAHDITLLEGEGGVGKSSIALDIIARITRGDAMPRVRT